MNITRYKQSCFLLETNGTKILIDPGSIDFDDNLLKEEWAGIDAVLLTHKHKDHVHVEGIEHLLTNGKTAIYSTKEVQDAYSSLKISIIAEGEIFQVNDITIEVTTALHGYIPKLREMNIEITENVGFIVDDGSTRFYHTSDTIGFPNEYSCDVLAIPVNNHGLCFGAEDAAMFAAATGATTVIPCHYDNPVFPADMEAVVASFAKANIPLKILDYRESVVV